MNKYKSSYQLENRNSPALYRILNHVDCFCSLSVVDMGSGYVMGLCSIENDTPFVLPLGVVLDKAVEHRSIIEHDGDRVRFGGERMTYGPDGAPDGIETTGHEWFIGDYLDYMEEEEAQDLSSILIDALKDHFEAKVSEVAEIIGGYARQPEKIKQAADEVQWLKDLIL